jgi:hypothetical protein
VLVENQRHVATVPRAEGPAPLRGTSPPWDGGGPCCPRWPTPDQPA